MCAYHDHYKHKMYGYSYEIVLIVEKYGLSVPERSIRKSRMCSTCFK